MPSTLLFRFLLSKIKIEKKIFFIGSLGSENHHKKENLWDNERRVVTANPLSANDTVAKPVLDIVNVADPRKVINLINHYKETENIKTIGYVAMQT